MKATIYKDSLYASRVTGGQQNESYGEFASKMSSFNSKKQASMEEYRSAAQAQDTAKIAQLQNENQQLVNEENEYKKQFLKGTQQLPFFLNVIV